MNDESLLSRLAPVTDEQAAGLVSRQAMAELAQDITSTPPVEPALRRGPAAGRPTRRRLTWAAAGTLAVAAAGAAAAAMIAAGGHPTAGGTHTANAAPASGRAAVPQASTTLTAWTVTKGADGALTVTIRQMKDPAGLQRTLQADGARVVVTGSPAWPTACGEWRGGDYRLGDQVVQTENQTGLPAADGSEFTIRPSDIPAGALLWIGLSQTGKPAGVVGPPGPMSVGYLTATRACTGS